MEMDEGAKRWIFKVAHKNLWRVQSYYEFEDLVQDGVMWWYMTVNRYCYRPRKRSHVMALFKTSFTNYLHDMASKRQKYLTIEEAQPLYVDEAEQRLVVTISDDNAAADEAELAATLSQASAPLKRFLALHAAGKLQEPYQRSKGQRETTAQRFARLTGDADVNYESELHALLA